MASSRSRRPRVGESPPARHLRVQSSLFQEVSHLFRSELSDPRLAGIALASFELTPDGRLARIGYSLSPEAAARGPGRVQEALVHASGYLRSQLALQLDLKRVPQLRFIYIGAASRPEADTSDTADPESGMASRPDDDPKGDADDPEHGAASRPGDDPDADASDPDALGVPSEDDEAWEGDS